MDKKKLIKIPQFKPLHIRQLYLKVIFWVFMIILSLETFILLITYFMFDEFNWSLHVDLTIFVMLGCVASAVVAATAIMVVDWLKALHERRTLDRSEDENKILADLHVAVAKNELLIYYQPQVNLTSGQITGAEALVRWRHAQRGFIEPSSFVALAEQSDLIIPMGNWILYHACKQNKEWLDQGINLRIAVNLSPWHFKDPTLVETVMEILEQTQLPARNLELEITETSMIQDMEGAIATMNRLSKLGILISMDDFGTGYSSLSNLDRLPIQKLKIDKAFVHGISPYNDDPNIAHSIVEMARKLGLITIAEGIETEYQKKYFTQLKCDEGQGYYFGKAMPATEFAKMIRP